MIRLMPVLLCSAFLLLLGDARAADAPLPAADVDWSVVAAGLTHDYLAAAAQPAAPDVRDSNLPLAALEIQKIRMRGAHAADEFTAKAQETSETMVKEALARLAAGRVALAGLTGGENPDGYLERAYIDRCDGDVQPYYCRLPANYDPAQAWPLVIFLHGYVTETSKTVPWVLPAGQWKMAADRGLILVLPHGRRNSDFLGIGEVDVLRVIEEMKRFYHIDPNRVALTGCSMGGYGGWAIGLRQPSLFSCLALMSGQTDFFTWERRPRDQVRYKSWCILQNNPLDLAPNARLLPMQVQHGELDNLVPVEHSRLIAPVMKQLGYSLDYTEYKGKGHYIYWEDPPFLKMFDFVMDKTQPAAPKHVTFKTFTPKQGQAYWVDVRKLSRFGDPAAPGEVDAVVADRELIVKTRGVAELWLDLPPALTGGQPLALSVNGSAAGQVAAGPHQVLIAADGAVTPAKAAAPPAARPRVGPAREVFNAPFLVVVASGGDAARANFNLQRANYFRQLWWAFAEGVCPMVLDTDLTPQLMASHNLVIFGEPPTVKLPGVADPAKLLPDGITMAPGRYAVGAQVFAGDKIGMYLLTPHPADDQKLILWCSGFQYGIKLPPNHQFDLIPDLLVYNDQVDWDGANHFLLGGFLGPEWRLDPARLDSNPLP
jgi:predicted esterase